MSPENLEDLSEDARDAAEMLGCTYYFISRGDWEEAAAAAREARDLCDELRDAQGSAESRLLLGFICYETKDFKSALPVLASAQQQYASLGDKQRQCAILYLLAHCHMGLEKPSKAVYALKLADNILREAAPAPQSGSSFLPDWETLKKIVGEMLTELADHAS